MTGKRRRFGRVRKLPSGRWQARYTGPDGLERPAPDTFPNKRDAEQWLSKKEAEIIENRWIDPDAGKISLGEYASAWIRERPNLRPKTIELYRWLLDRHIVPQLGKLAVGELSVAHVRAWRHRLIATGVSTSTTAKAYRLLRAVMNTAVDDELVRRNPCRIKGAGTESPEERPVLTIEQVFTLAGVVPRRYRALVLLGTFTSLRFGELVALRRRHLNLEARTVRVEESFVELGNGRTLAGPPKSAAGRRQVTFPAVIVPALRDHLAAFTSDQADALVFTSPTGLELRRSNFGKVWRRAVADAELSGTHFHDLRHTGNTLAAATGASLRELMQRMGHASTRAAIIYQHATEQRDRAIADGLDALIAEATGDASAGGDGGGSDGDPSPGEDPPDGATGT